MAKGTIMAKENMSNAEQFLWFGAARTRFHLSYLALWLDNASLILLSRLGRFFFFLVAAGFLSAVLIACAGGGGGSGGGSGTSPSDEDGVSLTFTPTDNGFRIANLSAFDDFVSLKITATSGNTVVVAENGNVNIAEFVDNSYYDFTGLADLEWKFEISGILSDGGEQEVNIVFAWTENRQDHGNNGIRPGANHDGDGRADSVDEDDDNDGVNDDHPDLCSTGETDWTSNGDTDHDGDGCQDSNEDTDDDNDGVNDDHPDECSKGVTGWTSNAGNDNDGDGCRDSDEDDDRGQGTDRDNDEVDDRFDQCPTSQNSNFVSTSANDIDGDGCEDEVEDVDDDGDGLIEIRTADELDAVRHQLDGSGRKLLDTGTADTTGCGGADGITQCNGYELVANISLADYVDDDNGKGWQPLGHDTNGGRSGCQGTAFSGTFEGNGFMISDLNISRPDEDCVGLFGHIAANSEIRNLRLHAEAVTGRDGVGTLVGDGESARIVYSSVVAAEVSGGRRVGGLVGDGASARIYSSSVVVAEVSGDDGRLGGLVGDGGLARIYSSSVVVGQVNGTTNSHVGGLVGFGHSARIFSSWVVMGRMRGGLNVGGLIGDGSGARIHSSSVVVNEVSGTSGGVGGLGASFSRGRIAYSYVVSGSSTTMLAGAGSGTGNASYWDSDTSKVTNGNHGEAKTTSDLRSPTGYDGIYATWSQDMNIFGDEDEPLAVWCDKDNSGNITMDERTIDNLIWDFGDSDQYPAIECTPIAPAEWRSWWSLNANGKPELDRARLDELLQ